MDKLIGRDINSIVLTPLQRLAILQENEARQQKESRKPKPQPQPRFQTTFKPTPQPEQTFVSSNQPVTSFQSSLHPNGPKSTIAQPLTTPSTISSLELQSNFLGEQLSDNDIDVNYDYVVDNEISSKSMIEQTFSLFENFAMRKNNPGQSCNRDLRRFWKSAL